MTAILTNCSNWRPNCRGDVARYQDGLKVATCIFEAAAWHRTVKVTCRCGNVGLFEGHGLWWKFQRKGWTDDFRDSRRRFYCRSCSQRSGAKVRPTWVGTCDDPPHICLPLPDEREWKRAMNRFRG